MRAKMNKAATKRYVIEFGGAMLAYVVVLVVALSLIEANPQSPWRIPLAVAPVVPVGFALLAFIRALGRMDELQRRIQLDAVGFGFGATAIITFTYGLLELVGFPPISFIWVLPLMAALWGVGAVFAARRYAA
jgi:hypothetical protein